MNIDIHDRNTQIGLGLLIVGLLALFGNLGIFAGLGTLLGMAMFVGAGVLVLRAYGDDRRRVWMLPVGFGLIGLGLATLDVDGSGGAFLGALGLGFLAIYLRRREQWWAILPGGVLLTLGVTASYDAWLRPGSDAGGTVFFLGLAATFAALYLLPSVNQRWAIWPSLGLAVVGVLTLDYRGGWVLPAILIGVGVWMLSRQYRPAEVPPSRPDGGPGGGAFPTVEVDSAGPAPRTGEGTAAATSAAPPSAAEASAGAAPAEPTTAATAGTPGEGPRSDAGATDPDAERVPSDVDRVPEHEVPPHGPASEARVEGEPSRDAPRDAEERERRDG